MNADTTIVEPMSEDDILDVLCRQRAEINRLNAAVDALLAENALLRLAACRDEQIELEEFRT